MLTVEAEAEEQASLDRLVYCSEKIAPMYIERTCCSE